MSTSLRPTPECDGKVRTKANPLTFTPMQRARMHTIITEMLECYAEELPTKAIIESQIDAIEEVLNREDY